MNQKNGSTPDGLGGLGDLLPAEVLKELNELLELLHKTDYTNQGGIVFNIYEKGSQHVDHVDNQYFYGDACPIPKKQKDVPESPNLPPQLSTDLAMVLWKKAQDAGYVDAKYQPLISRTQAALLADAMAKRLGIREKWKVFGELWRRTKMYKDYYQALEQKQSLGFQDKLKLLFD